MKAEVMRLLAKSGRAEDAYALRVDELVRARYSVSDELALLRQKDDKPDDFSVYNEFAEECKAQAHREVFGE